MINAARPLSSQITNLLTQLLREGIDVSSDTLFFAESTYGINPEELGRIITDRCFEEREILINLLLFPTHKMREKLEPLLVNGPLTEENIQYLVEKIVNEISEIHMHMPVGSSFFWPVTYDGVSHFVGKLYMTRALDPMIRAVLTDRLPEEIATRVNVSIRCRNLQFSQDTRQFMLAFIDKAAHRLEEFEGLVELLLTVSNQIPARMPMSEYLFEQREHQKKRLYEIEEFRQKSEQYGMEYLMMQNYQVPHESEEHVSGLLQNYNIIIDEVLNLKNPRDNYINRRDLGTFDRENDLNRLFKYLS